MAEVFRTPDGPWTVFDKNDMEFLLRHYCGDEVAAYVMKNMMEYDTKKERTEMEFNSDFESIQFQNEEYHDTILEAHNGIENIINNIENSKRINKDRLVIDLIHIKDDLWNMV